MAGTEASAYADHLLEDRTRVRGVGSIGATALAMARPSEIEAACWLSSNHQPPSCIAGGSQLGDGSRRNRADAAGRVARLPPRRPEGAGTDASLDHRTASVARAGAAHEIERCLPPLPAPRVRHPRLPRRQRHLRPPPLRTPAQTTRPDEGDAQAHRRRALMVALDDSNQRVREQALNTLISIRDERAIPALIRH
jgi:hypothetical protein